MHCGAVDHQSSYEHAISDLAQRSLIIVCKYCGESRVEKKNFFLVNYKCVGPTIISAGRALCNVKVRSCRILNL